MFRFVPISLLAHALVLSLSLSLSLALALPLPLVLSLILYLPLSTAFASSVFPGIIFGHCCCLFVILCHNLNKPRHVRNENVV